MYAKSLKWLKRKRNVLTELKIDDKMKFRFTVAVQLQVTYDACEKNYCRNKNSHPSGIFIFLFHYFTFFNPSFTAFSFNF